VARAKAFTKAQVWAHAATGTVEVLLVPYLPAGLRSGGRVRLDQLKEHETDDALDDIRRALDQRRPLGTTCLVNWVQYKTARVVARVVVHRGEDTDAVKAMLPRIRAHVSVPVGVGFGIRDATTARAIGEAADAVVIGSKIIQLIGNQPRDQVASTAQTFLREIRTALDS
jgi:hypothetical protein